MKPAVVLGLVVMLAACAATLPPLPPANPAQAHGALIGTAVKLDIILGGPDLSRNGSEVEAAITHWKALFGQALLQQGFVVAANERDAEATLTVRISFFTGRPSIRFDVELTNGTRVIDTLTMTNEAAYDFACPPADCPVLVRKWLVAQILNQTCRSPSWVRYAQQRKSRPQAPRAAQPAAAAGAPLATVPPPPTPPPARPALRAAPQPNALALVVGIERYRAGLPRPSGARRDAERFAALLRESMGVPEENMVVALDEMATRSDIEKHLDWLKGQAGPGSRIYLYFSGHGAPEADGSSYLLPYDGDPRYLKRTGLLLGEVMAALGQTKAREIVAFVDACFSGAGGRSVLPPGARPLVAVKQTAAQPRVAFFAAAASDEISGPVPGGTGGLFTDTVLAALATGQADFDGDGAVSLRELEQWVRSRVVRAARRDNRSQTPTLTVGAGAGDPAQFLLLWWLPRK
jgi:hypothetical protein